MKRYKEHYKCIILEKCTIDEFDELCKEHKYCENCPMTKTTMYKTIDNICEIIREYKYEELFVKKLYEEIEDDEDENKD